MPATFSWTIISPQQAIQRLISTIDNMHLSRGACISLETPLIITIKLLNRQLGTAACNTFNAFLNNVNANQASGQLTAQQAATLREEAAPIQRAMGCALSPLSLSIDSTNNSTAVETINTKSQATTTPSTTPRPQQQPPTAYGLNNHNNKSDNRSPTIVSVLPF